LNLLSPLYRLADSLRYQKHRKLGTRGEDTAHRFLRAQGYTVVARNWRPPQGGGEIDLVAWQSRNLVFVEVKTRATGQWSAPERAIDPDKIRTLQRAARDYIRRSGADPSQVRFDTIAIAGDHLEHFQDAFAVDLSL